MTACKMLANRIYISSASVEIGRQVHLLSPWARHLTGLPLPLSV